MRFRVAGIPSIPPCPPRWLQGMMRRCPRRTFPLSLEKRSAHGNNCDSTVSIELEFDAFSCKQSLVSRGVLLHHLGNFVGMTQPIDVPLPFSYEGFEVKKWAEPAAGLMHKGRGSYPSVNPPHACCQESSSTDSISSCLASNPHQAVTLISQNAAGA